MGVFTHEFATPSSVDPARLYKAMALDFDNLFPKIVDYVQSVETIEGNGAAITIKKITFVEDSRSRRVRGRQRSRMRERTVIFEGVMDFERFNFGGVSCGAASLMIERFQWCPDRHTTVANAAQRDLRERFYRLCLPATTNARGGRIIRSSPRLTTTDMSRLRRRKQD
ncbi:hypothetical protein PIB30_012756 [Stylosanthes scabra]|uniref:Bet v I/Major latex protein domain-containing protein n=1 Tax=Stylosanthes scabra TaxID=79078 RepID=A0ABU6S6S3_9FABA|nr:hypothetical protein [Stylosanthes scabra]